MAAIKAAKNMRDPTETPNIFVSLRNSEVLQKAVAKFSASPFRFSGKLCMVRGAFEQVLLCVQHDPAVLDGYFVAFDGRGFFLRPACAQRAGQKEGGWQERCPDRSRGGFSNKIHCFVERTGAKQGLTAQADDLIIPVAKVYSQINLLN